MLQKCYVFAKETVYIIIIDRINTTLKDKTAYSTCAQHKIHKPQMNYYKSNETLDTWT